MNQITPAYLFHGIPNKQFGDLSHISKEKVWQNTPGSYTTSSKGNVISKDGVVGTKGAYAAAVLALLKNTERRNIKLIVAMANVIKKAKTRVPSLCSITFPTFSMIVMMVTLIVRKLRYLGNHRKQKGYISSWPPQTEGVHQPMATTNRRGTSAHGHRIHTFLKQRVVFFCDLLAK